MLSLTQSREIWVRNYSRIFYCHYLNCKEIDSLKTFSELVKYFDRFCDVDKASSLSISKEFSGHTFSEVLSSIEVDLSSFISIIKYQSLLEIAENPSSFKTKWLYFTKDYENYLNAFKKLESIS